MILLSRIPLILICAAAGWLLTYLALRMVSAVGVLDVPNARSSHTRPTPRGGGISIACIVLAVEVWGLATHKLPPHIGYALVIPGVLVAVMGGWDDIRSLPAWLRLCVQTVAAVIAVVLLGHTHASLLGNTQALALPPVVIRLLDVSEVIGIVWLTNLYNFMDGIDGIAGVQGIIAGLSQGLFLALANASGTPEVALSVGASTAGFLILNRPPAKIFMGDIGSSFLGCTFAILIIAGTSQTAVPAWCLALPLLPFMFDSTVTVLRRLYRSERLTVAHRSHAYQRAVRAGASHLQVTTATGILAIICACGAGLAIHIPEIRVPIALSSFILVAVAYLSVDYVTKQHKAPSTE